MKIGDDVNKYMGFHGKGWKIISNWILPALIFIVLIAIGVHTYLVTVGGY